MPPGMKGILCIKFDLFKIKNTDFWAAYGGVAVNWRKTGVPSFGHRQLPNNFLFLTELHFGGCGTYTSSDRWRNAFGTAIGLR